ncbi:MarR family transcriptional regulator [Clavibacter sp. VKM Ac-2873]|uniref:MarR family winged helix-turn-helix transcriptional regulator n=1 Tax=Clavibacter sp. VKM Ac-2873 TaxID=2783813 RepID=UPI00188D59E9|nr:MarR family transcriptional regulator [Clavibacter sp. VKM Ac-2873]MBF4617482.1 MarR family transcriptional regulator [Clavibacter sp. VKM Ac-2873]
MTRNARLANDAWEALFRAQVVLIRTFTADDIWTDLTQTEYDVLYALAKAPDGLNMVEINRNLLITQGGVSRLVTRLQQRGLITRCADPSDARATRISLTPEGARLQRSIGKAHADAVTAAMSRALTAEQMEQLRDLGRQIVAVIDPAQAEPHHTSHTRSRAR